MPPRVVLISTAVAHDAVPHAGGRYLRDVYRLLEQESELTVISPGRRSNREAARLPGAPAGRHLLLGLEPGRGRLLGLLNRVAINLDGRLRSHDPGMPYLPFVIGLFTSREALAAIREADVIDLQWSESVRLVHVLRALNHRARIVGTFHDVMSQGFSRMRAETAAQQRRRRRLVRRARRHEGRMVARLDCAVVFSEKDVRCLGSPPNATVVRPPLAVEPAPVHPAGGDGSHTVVSVAYWARDENSQGIAWAIGYVWPRVRAAVPDAHLRLLGAGVRPELAALVERSPGVTIAGWVDDLGAEYLRAAVALVSLQQGAGVKFKTVDALVHGLPTITTSVGAEGIAGADLFAGLSDDPESLATHLIEALKQPIEVAERAKRAQAWALREYGRTRFQEAVLSALGLRSAPVGSRGVGGTPD